MSMRMMIIIGAMMIKTVMKAMIQLTGVKEER